MRRLRKNKNIRRLVRNVNLSNDDFLYPVFVKEGIQNKQEIESIAGQYHYSLEALNGLVEVCEERNIPGILLFGIPEKKDKVGSEAFNEDGIVQKAIRRIKEVSNLFVFTDVCLCQYTTHGHCGILAENGLNNDKTLDVLTRVALSHASSGADYVSPSGMIDGQVKSIRKSLDEQGYDNVGIMSYSAKFSSNFYGPFREAAESVPKGAGGPRKLNGRDTYQMDFRSANQPMREIALDLNEGSDIVMVKPALPYLDVIYRANKRFDAPLAAYQVSGEHAMLMRGSEPEDLNRKGIFLESFISMKRAGADFIITYAALEASRWLDED